MCGYDGEAESGSNIVNAVSLVVTDVEFWHTDGVQCGKNTLHALCGL